MWSPYFNKIQSKVLLTGSLSEIKWNSCKDLIFGRDNVKEILEINRYFQGFNRGSFLYPKDTTTSFYLI